MTRVVVNLLTAIAMGLVLYGLGTALDFDPRMTVGVPVAFGALWFIVTTRDQRRKTANPLE